MLVQSPEAVRALERLREDRAAWEAGEESRIDTAWGYLADDKAKQVSDDLSKPAPGETSSPRRRMRRCLPRLSRSMTQKFASPPRKLSRRVSRVLSRWRSGPLKC